MVRAIPLTSSSGDMLHTSKISGTNLQPLMPLIMRIFMAAHALDGVAFLMQLAWRK